MTSSSTPRRWTSFSSWIPIKKSRNTEPHPKVPWHSLVTSWRSRSNKRPIKSSKFRTSKLESSISSPFTLKKAKNPTSSAMRERKSTSWNWSKDCLKVFKLHTRTKTQSYLTGSSLCWLWSPEATPPAVQTRRVTIRRRSSWWRRLLRLYSNLQRTPKCTTLTWIALFLWPKTSVSRETQKWSNMSVSPTKSCWRNSWEVAVYPFTVWTNSSLPVFSKNVTQIWDRVWSDLCWYTSYQPNLLTKLTVVKRNKLRVADRTNKDYWR